MQPGPRYAAVVHMIKKGDLLALQRALDAGPDPNLMNRFGWTLLMAATLRGRSDFAQLLLSRGADPVRTNKFGDSALSLAQHKGLQKLTSMLQTAVTMNAQRSNSR
jgi:ankyrin repeat protein